MSPENAEFSNEIFGMALFSLDRSVLDFVSVWFFFRNLGLVESICSKIYRILKFLFRSEENNKWGMTENRFSNCRYPSTAPQTGEKATKVKGGYINANLVE